jgi:hypothetical protein
MDSQELSSESSTDNPPDGAAPESAAVQVVLPFAVSDVPAQLSDDSVAVEVTGGEVTEIEPPLAETVTALPEVEAARALLTVTLLFDAALESVNWADAITPSGIMLKFPLAMQV